MESASSADLQHALALVHEWHQAESPDQLTSLATAGLRDLIPCDAVGWNDLNLAGGSSRFVIEPADYWMEGMGEILSRLMHEHPIIEYVARTGDGSVLTISDFLTVHEFHRRELYCELYRPLKTEDQLAFGFSINSAKGLIGGFAFNRSRRSFTARDRIILNLLRPHLSFCYENLHARAIAQQRLEAMERGLEEERRAVIVLNEENIEIASRTALQLLSRWFSGASPQWPLVGPPLVLERDQMRLTVRRIAGDPPLLLLDETYFAPDPERARTLGISHRESEVLTLVARGLTNAQIATELFISKRTVQKHLEHSYLKLGVNNRQEAIAVLLGN